MNNLKAAYFLGANTPNGFYSLYSDYISNPSDFFYFIKAGPGCGKSSFMKRVAYLMERRKIKAEYIYCSADKASLDGVYFPELKIGILDATAPHILEPSIQGVSGTYLNLGRFYDISAIKSVAENIRRLNYRYKEEYRKAYAALKNASLLLPAMESEISNTVLATIMKRASGIASREFKGYKSKNFTTSKRFLNGISADGHTFLAETIPSLAKTVYVADNDLGLSNHLMVALKNSLESLGIYSFLCLSPLEPEKILHIIVPELSLAFVSQSTLCPYPYEYSKHLRLDAIIEKDKIKAHKTKIRPITKAYKFLEEDALSHFRAAKSLHDEMEKLYNPFVDFDGIYSFADKFAEGLLQ